jgi:hypothetical protein
MQKKIYFKMTAFFIFSFFMVEVANSAPRSYQIGDQGKQFVTKSWLDAVGENEYKGAFATAEIIFKDQGGFSSGTGFYVGKFSNTHLLVTNNHVIPNSKTCENVGAIFFPFSKQKIKCKRLIRTWKSIDTSIIEIELSAKFEKFLSDKALTFDFNSPVEKGTPLMTFGYGYFKNNNRFPKKPSHPWSNQANRIKVSHDLDCKVFSGSNDIRILNDVYLVSTGCDGSPGDSGSAVLSRETGLILGIASKAVSSGQAWRTNSSSLDKVYNGAGPVDLVWKPMWTFMVPSQKVNEIIVKDLPNMSHEDQKILRPLFHL